MRSLLVVSELAFSLVLLIGAGLLIRSFVRLQEVSPGFDPDNVISMRVGAGGPQFTSRDSSIEFYRQLGERIAAVPGVRIRGAVSSLPFTSAVGVVGTVKQYGLDTDGRIVVYRPTVGLLPYLVARTSSEPTAVAAAIVRAIHEVNPTVPLYDIRTMQDRMKDSLARQRFSTIMLGVFALFALILAVVGVYGVMSHLVTQSTHDIGVRMALGAQRRSIVGMVLRQGMELTGAGIVGGLIGAAVLTRVMATLLFGISTTDALTFSAVPVILAGIALLAGYLPARRATQVDPVVALRNE